MKKLLTFIKAKESEEKTTSSPKKSPIKERKASAPSEQINNQPNDLFWDDYSDIGYC